MYVSYALPLLDLGWYVPLLVLDSYQQVYQFLLLCSHGHCWEVVYWSKYILFCRPLTFPVYMCTICMYIFVYESSVLH